MMIIMNIKTAFLPFIRSDTFLIFKNRQHIMSLTINTPFTSLGKTLPKVTMAAATTQVTPAPGQEDGDRDQAPATVFGRTKPLVGTKP